MEETPMATSNEQQRGLQLPRAQERPTSQEETVYYLEAANGMTVRVPQSKLESWQAEQDKQRRGIRRELTPAELRFKEQLLERIYGPKK